MMTIVSSKFLEFFISLCNNYENESVFTVALSLDEQSYNNLYRYSYHIKINVAHGLSVLLIEVTT